MDRQHESDPQGSVDAEALCCLARARKYLDTGLIDDAVPELQDILALSSPEREHRPQLQFQNQARNWLAEARFKLRQKRVEVVSDFNELLVHVRDPDQALLYHACRTLAALSAFYSLCGELQAEGIPAERGVTQESEQLIEAFGSEEEASAEADGLRRRANRLIEEITKLEEPANTPSSQSKAAQMQNMAEQMHNTAHGISMCLREYDKIGIQCTGPERDLLAGTTLGANNSRTTMLAHGLAITMKARNSPGTVDGATLAMAAECLENVVRSFAAEQDAINMQDDVTEERARWISSFEQQKQAYWALQDCLMLMDKDAEALVVAERGRARGMLHDMQRHKLPKAPALQENATVMEVLEDLQAAMAASGAALAIEYSLIREDLLLVWAVQPSGVVASQCVDLSQHQLSCSKLGKRLQELHINMSKVSKWASTVKNLHSEDSGLEKEAQEAASAGSAALQPIDDVLKVLASVLLPKEITAVLETLLVPNEFSPATVLFIPHRQLHAVPFASLPLPEGKGFQVFIERHGLAIAPSISVAGICAKRWWQLAEEDSCDLTTACVIGNPSETLSHAEDEALFVAGKTCAEHKVILGDEATLGNVFTRLSSAQLVHMAAHGVISEEYPQGAVQLARGNFLTAKAILDAFGENDLMKARLTVISTCKSGGGQITGEGMIGLGRALALAGCPCTVLALWEVDDAATCSLMKEFYTQLIPRRGEARTVCEALRHAMLAQMKVRQTDTAGPASSHPALWAAFQPIGATCVSFQQKTFSKNTGSSEILNDGTRLIENDTRGIFNLFKLRKEDRVGPNHVGFVNMRGEDVWVRLQSAWFLPEHLDKVRKVDAEGNVAIPAGGGFKLSPDWSTKIHFTQQPGTRTICKVPADRKLHKLPLEKGNTDGEARASVVVLRPQNPSKPFHMLLDNIVIKGGKFYVIQSSDDLPVAMDLSAEEWSKFGHVSP